ADALHVEEGDEDHHDDADELLDGETDGVFGAEVEWMDYPGCRGDRWKENAEVAGESNGHSSDCAGLDDEKERPAVEESPKWRIGFAEIDVLAAGVWEERGEFAVGESGG